jgi:hypothetical protein
MVLYVLQKVSHRCLKYGNNKIQTVRSIWIQRNSQTRITTPRRKKDQDIKKDLQDDQRNHVKENEEE